MTTRHIAVLVGSLRKDSFNRKLALAMAALAPPTLKLDIVEIGGLSFYNQDLDDTVPADWAAFRSKLQAADGYLFVTPEYNRSVPGVLKNAIDVASRPYGKSSFGNGKPAAVVSLSPGAMGGFGANHHLRQSLVFLNVAAMPQPEAYLGGAAKMFDDAGEIASDGTREFVAKFLAAFGSWVDQHQPA